MWPALDSGGLSFLFGDAVRLLTPASYLSFRSRLLALTPGYPGLFGFIMIYDSSFLFIHLSFDLGMIVLPLLLLRFLHLQAYSHHKRRLVLMSRLIGSLENVRLQMDLLSIRRSVGLSLLYDGCSLLSHFPIIV